MSKQKGAALVQELGAVIANIRDMQERYTDLDVDLQPIEVILTLLDMAHDKFEVEFVEDDEDIKLHLV